MLKYPEGLEGQHLVVVIIFFHTFCMQEEGALVRMCICAGSSETSLLADAISSVLCADPYGSVWFLATNCGNFFTLSYHTYGKLGRVVQLVMCLNTDVCLTADRPCCL